VQTCSAVDVCRVSFPDAGRSKGRSSCAPAVQTAGGTSRVGTYCHRGRLMCRKGGPFRGAARRDGVGNRSDGS
jgi:hypothetical protein